MKIMHLIDSLDYSGSARQIKLLSPALVRDHTIEVCSLGVAGPWSESLRRLGVPVHTLDWTRWFDPSALWNLRDLLRRFDPDLVHVWRLPALRMLAVVAKHLLPRVVMSAPLPPKGRLAWWDRQLLNRVRCLAVAGVSDQQHCVHQGIAQPKLRVVPPAVAIAPSALKETAPAIICVGRLEREEGLRDAVWAFDLFRHLHPEHQLRLVGSGSMQTQMQTLAVGLGNEQQVRFLGNRTDLAEQLQAAQVAWIPSHANCGRQVALEAMAAGCAVVASDVPCLRDVIIPGETGFLTPVGYVAQPARLTRKLYQAPALLERIRQAAARHVAQHHAVPEIAQRWRDVYQSAA